MMDVVFQLIVFFLLVTNFTSADLPELEPPVPMGSVAYEIENRTKITVNIVPEDGDKSVVKEVTLGILSVFPGAYAELTDKVKFEVEKGKDEGKDIEVDLRVDRRIHYSFVQPVMNAITKAGVSRINLIAITSDMADASIHEKARGSTE